MSRTVAPIEPSVLRWARESSGLNLEEAAKRLSVRAERLARAETGDREAALTLNQARKAAQVYGRPFAVLFLPAPPNDVTPEVRFRRFSDAPPLPWSAAMTALARRVPALQDEALSVFDALDEQAQWPIVRRDVVAAPSGTKAEVIRSRLSVSIAEQKAAAAQDRAGYGVFRLWRDAIEDLGILVLQDGSLPPREMRGFLAKHDRLPAIVLNTKEDVRARLFTMLHEFVHLQLDQASEDTCETLAGEVLFPADEVERDIASTTAQTTGELVGRLAFLYGLTRLAVAVRLARLQLVQQADADEFIAELRSRGDDPRTSGGSHYQNVVSRLGRGLVKRTIEAVDQGALSPLSAARMIGVRVEHIGELRRRIWGPEPA